jgi:hypothetical protein
VGERPGRSAATLRFCEQPSILDRIREHPEQVSEIVEELLRLDGSFICIPSSRPPMSSTPTASGTGTSRSARARTGASAPASPG